MADIKAHFTLIGDTFDPQLVTERTGITPSWVRHKGEVFGNGHTFDHTEWGIETEEFREDDLLPVIEQLCSVLENTPGTLLRELAEECNAEWNLLFDVDIHDGRDPVGYFPSEFVQFCGEIKASIGFDTIIYSHDIVSKMKELAWVVKWRFTRLYYGCKGFLDQRLTRARGSYEGVRDREEDIYSDTTTGELEDSK